MATNTTEISTLKDDKGNTVIPLTMTEAVLHNGRPLTEELAKIDTLIGELSTIREMLGNIQTLAMQLNDRLNEHTSE